jgi:hypothetical protein
LDAAGCPLCPASSRYAVSPSPGRGGAKAAAAAVTVTVASDASHNALYTVRFANSVTVMRAGRGRRQGRAGQRAAVQRGGGAARRGGARVRAAAGAAALLRAQARPPLRIASPTPGRARQTARPGPRLGSDHPSQMDGQTGLSWPQNPSPLAWVLALVASRDAGAGDRSQSLPEREQARRHPSPHGTGSPASLVVPGPGWNHVASNQVGARTQGKGCTPGR